MIYLDLPIIHIYANIKRINFIYIWEPDSLQLMKRTEFRQLFRSNGPVVTPVIHVLDVQQTAKNIDIAIAGGVPGVFLINHDFPVDEFLPIVRETRSRYPSLWMGLNFLAVPGDRAFPVLAELERDGCRIDAYWADDACIDEHATLESQIAANRIREVREQSGWNGFYLGGTCFKKQREVNISDYGVSATLATHFMDAVCTSGVATGKEADLDKISTFRESIGEHVLALASGVTPANARTYHQVDCFMVATGINVEGDFYNIDPQKLEQLMTITEEMQQNHE